VDYEYPFQGVSYSPAGGPQRKEIASDYEATEFKLFGGAIVVRVYNQFVLINFPNGFMLDPTKNSFDGLKIGADWTLPVIYGAQLNSTNIPGSVVISSIGEGFRINLDSLVSKIAPGSYIAIDVLSYPSPVGSDSEEVFFGNYTGLWWNSPAGSESGWGINLSHQGRTIFATWFGYGLKGEPYWFEGVAVRTDAGVWSGPVYTAVGSSLGNVPYDLSKFRETPEGPMRLVFSDRNNATLIYTLGNTRRTHSITRQEFATPVPTCTWSEQTRSPLTKNYQGLWWNAAEPGWGINFAHQGPFIFATWFTYGPPVAVGLFGNPTWMFAVAKRIGSGVYGGPIFASTGTPFYYPFQQSNTKETEIGSARIAFLDHNSASLSYDLTLAGQVISQTKAITRQVFAPGGTVCEWPPSSGFASLRSNKTTAAPFEPVVLTIDNPRPGMNYAVSVDMGFGYVVELPFRDSSPVLSLLMPQGRVDATGAFSPGIVEFRLLESTGESATSAAPVQIAVGALPTVDAPLGTAVLGLIAGIDRVLLDSIGQYNALSLSGPAAAKRTALLKEINAHRSALAGFKAKIQRAIAGESVTLGVGPNGNAVVLSPQVVALLDRQALAFARQFGTFQFKSFASQVRAFGDGEDPIESFANEFFNGMKKVASDYREVASRATTLVKVAAGVTALAIGVTSPPGLALLGLVAITSMVSLAHTTAMSAILDAGPKYIYGSEVSRQDFQGTAVYFSGEIAESVILAGEELFFGLDETAAAIVATGVAAVDAVRDLAQDGEICLAPPTGTSTC
jgi:hypothetical protein